SKYPSAYSLFELLDHVRGEPVRVCGKALLNYQAAHFPVTRRRVFPVGPGRSLAKRPGGPADRGKWQRPDIAEPNFSQIWHLELAMGQDVAQGISVGVSIFVGVRHFADTYAVQHNQDYAFEATRSTHSMFSLAADSKAGMPHLSN